MICFLCKKNNFNVVYELKSRQILECQNDGLFFSKEKDPRTEFYGKNYYQNSPYSTFFNLNERYFLKKLEKIKEITGENKPTILDVGCGWGNFLGALQHEKINYLGIDTSDEAIRICRSKNLNVKKTILQDLVKENPGKFSAITMFQVIEHLEDPLPLLVTAKKLLKKNGIILLTTPNNNSPLRKLFAANWSVYDEPSHFVFYNKQTLKETLIRAGFKNARIRTDTIRFLSLGYILNKLVNSTTRKLEIIPVPTDPFGDLQAIAYNL